MKNFKDSFLKITDNIESSIEIIHKAGLRIGLVVDNQERLLGTVTDGDIRRALLSHKDMSLSVAEIMNSSPTTSSENFSRTSAITIMKEKDILHLPILNKKGVIIALESINDLIDEPSLENPVVIMAGGFGKRLQPLTNDTPKPLLKVGSTPILETIIVRFKEFGFHNFFISIHYKADMIKEYFEDGKKWGVSIEYLLEQEPLGTAGALSLLPENIPDLPIILMNGDLVTELDFLSLLKDHSQSQSDATVCVAEYDFQVPYGVLELEGTKVKEIIEKPTHRFFVNAGIYAVNRSLLKTLKPGQYLDMPDLLSTRINDKDGLNTFPIFEEWIDIGRISDFKRANNQRNDK